MTAPHGRALLGGTFNPLHAGHMRLALEVLDSLPDQLEQVDFIPCANPPHKEGRFVLPFSLRAAMVEAACAPFPRLRVNGLEGSRTGYSYTWDTLLAYRRTLPVTPLYFLLGSEDFAQLDTWKHGLDLPQLADMLVIPRKGETAEVFTAVAHRFWPQARAGQPLRPQALRLDIPAGGSLHFLPVPRLDISATRIRQYWLENKNIHFLVPETTRAQLEERRGEVWHCWQQGATL